MYTKRIISLIQFTIGVFIFSQAAFERLPQNRELEPRKRAEAEALINLGCNRKKLQNKIATETGKHLTLKDLKNSPSLLKKGDKNTVVKAVNLLEIKYLKYLQ